MQIIAGELRALVGTYAQRDRETNKAGTAAIADGRESMSGRAKRRDGHADNILRILVCAFFLFYFFCWRGFGLRPKIGVIEGSRTSLGR